MSCNLHNLVVLIKDEAELQQAREMLQANGELFSSHPLFSTLLDNKDYNYLARDETNWHIACKSERHTEITLPELEQKLKEKQDEQSKTVNHRQD